MPSVDFIQAMGQLMAGGSMARKLPPIQEFIELYDRGAKPYPAQYTILKMIFLDIEHMDDFDHFIIGEWLKSSQEGGEVRIPLDIYERMDWCRRHGYRNFNTVIYCGGRRGGKGFIGGKIAEYKIAEMLAYGSPQRAFGIDESHEIHVDVLATSFSQAQGMLYNDIKDSIISNDWLAPYIYSVSNDELRMQSSSDRNREAKVRQQQEALGRKRSIRTPNASIVIARSAADSAKIRGRASFMQAFDEFAHGLDTESKLSSAQIYEAATPSVLQFGGSGIIYVPSSPWSSTGKFYELYQQAFETDSSGRSVNPHMFAIKIPSWGPYDYWEYDPRKRSAIILPPSKSREVAAKERQNPEAFDVEFRANFARTENPYMSSSVIDSLFQPFPRVGDDRNVLSDRGLITRRYVAHADAGRSQDNFCFALGHREMVDGHWHAFIDVMKTWQPQDFPEDEGGVRRVDYTQVMEWIRRTFGSFFCTTYSMDQWNSAMILDQVRKDALEGRLLNPSMEVLCDAHTQKQNFLRYEAFKTACYQGWVHIPRKVEYIHKVGAEACLVEEELRYMIVRSGNTVTWPTTGKITHGDMIDAVSTVVTRLLADQSGDDADSMGSSVVGAALGGYNSWDGGVMTPAVTAAMQDAGDDYMRRMGYY